MRKISAPEVAPGICFICEQAHADGLEWVDTLREFDTAIVTPLSGRKVLCSRCIVAAGALIGLRPSAAVEESLLRAEMAERRVARLRALVGEACKTLSPDNLDRVVDSTLVPAETEAAAREAAERLPRLPVADVEPVVEDKPAPARRSS